MPATKPIRFRDPFLTVRVTPNDLETARQIRNSPTSYVPTCDSCPVAIAATRALRAKLRRHPNCSVRVGRTSIVINNRQSYDFIASVSMLPEVLKLVDAYDKEVAEKVPCSIPKEGVTFELPLAPGLTRFPTPLPGQVWRHEFQAEAGARWENRGEVVVTSNDINDRNGYVRVEDIGEHTLKSGGWYKVRFTAEGTHERGSYKRFPRTRFIFTGRTKS